MHKKAPATAPAPGVPTPKQRLGGESSVVPRTSLPSPVDYKATPDTPPPPPRLCQRERTAPALARPLLLSPSVAARPLPEQPATDHNSHF